MQWQVFLLLILNLKVLLANQDYAQTWWQSQLTLGDCKHKIPFCCQVVIQFRWAKQTWQQGAKTPGLHIASHLCL
jgi:hypothetical protein